MNKCYFCDSPIDSTNRSSEHIHQALSGLFESVDVWCRKCNSKFGTNIDAKFVEIFASITETFNIKTSRTKSESKYWGRAICKDGTTYRVQIKGKKIWNVFDSEGKNINRFIRIENLSPVEFEFNVCNIEFVSGLKKIAFNYAAANRIHPKKLHSVFN